MKRPRFRWLEWAILVLFAGQIAIALGTYANTQDLHRQAAQGHLAYRAECTYLGDLKHRASDSQRFLVMTPAERVRRFGNVVGAIPPTIIRAQLVNEKRAVHSMRGLRC